MEHTLNTKIYSIGLGFTFNPPIDREGTKSKEGETYKVEDV